MVPCSQVVQYGNHFGSTLVLQVNQVGWKGAVFYHLGMFALPQS